MIRFTTSPGISPVFRISSADVYRKYQAEEDTDVSEEVDCGQEWPDCENTDVARYREFYQVGGSVVDNCPTRLSVFIFILLPPAFHLNIIASAVL